MRSETAQSKELKEGACDRRATTMRRWSSKQKTTECCFLRSETAQSKELKEEACDRRATTMRRWREMRSEHFSLLQWEKGNHLWWMRCLLSISKNNREALNTVTPHPSFATQNPPSPTGEGLYAEEVRCSLKRLPCAR